MKIQVSKQYVMRERKQGWLSRLSLLQHSSLGGTALEQHGHDGLAFDVHAWGFNREEKRSSLVKKRSTITCQSKYETKKCPIYTEGA